MQPGKVMPKSLQNLTSSKRAVVRHDMPVGPAHYYWAVWFHMCSLSPGNHIFSLVLKGGLLTMEQDNSTNKWDI